jgi:hypothetical protein
MAGSPGPITAAGHPPLKEETFANRRAAAAKLRWAVRR